MSVIVTDRKMPESCLNKDDIRKHCMFAGRGCQSYANDPKGSTLYTQKKEDCPLRSVEGLIGRIVELPKTDGKYVDVFEVSQAILEYCNPENF